MSRHSGLVRLHHMLDSAREAVALVEGKTRHDLENTRLLELGLTRLVEIIGEAAARVPNDLRDRLPGIPWADVVGMRNKLILTTPWILISCGTRWRTSCRPY